MLPKYNLDWSSGKVFGKDLIKQVNVDNEGFIIDKYKMYDYALANGLIGVDAAATSLLEDDSVFAYAFLKWEGEPIRMKYYQDAIMCDTHKRIDVEAANQQGKSFSLCVKGAVNFLKDHGKNFTIGLISKSMPQNSMNMRMVRKMLKESNITYDSGGNDNMMVMTHNLGNGITNTLVCSVASTSALGYPFDLELLDEFEFWENPEGLEYMYDQVLKPRTFKTRGQIIIYSNPNGKNFVSENLHKREITVNGKKEYEFHVYNIDFLDNPANSKDEWDVAQSHTHPIIFASTMAAKRTESEGSALTDTDIKGTEDKELTENNLYLTVDQQSYWFLDLGFINDQSCLIGGWLDYPKKYIKDSDGYGSYIQDTSQKPIFKFAVYVYPQAHPTADLWNKQMLDSVPNMIKRFGNNMVQFEMDITGKEGNEVLAQESGLGVYGTKMTGPWKATHYERFITLCKQGRIKVSWVDNYVDGKNKNFVAQARTLKISTKLPNGNTRPYPLYHHEKESDHDDILDAVVGCLSLMDDEMNPPMSSEFFGAPESGPLSLEEQVTQDRQEAYELSRKRKFEEMYMW